MRNIQQKILNVRGHSRIRISARLQRKHQATRAESEVRSLLLIFLAPPAVPVTSFRSDMIPSLENPRASGKKYMYMVRSHSKVYIATCAVSYYNVKWWKILDSAIHIERRWTMLSRRDSGRLTVPPSLSPFVSPCYYKVLNGSSTSELIL